MSLIFVFGSNLAGHHGSGAAKEAEEKWGAKKGIGVGRRGNSYAIPTKDERIITLPLPVIHAHVADFILYAIRHSNDYFLITRVGCGLAGYKDEDIAHMFAAAPQNCHIPMSFVSKMKQPL